MSHNRLQQSIPEGEALRYQDDIRTGGEIGMTDERILILEDEPVSIPFENVKSVNVRVYDWFMLIMSVALVVIGLVAMFENPVGLIFIIAGVISLIITYRKRGQITINMHIHAKPYQTYPDDITAFQESFETIMKQFEQEERDE